MLECIELIERLGGHRVDSSLGDDDRNDDPICCIRGLAKMRRHYPEWDVRISLEEIVGQMIAVEARKLDRRISSNVR